MSKILNKLSSCCWFQTPWLLWIRTCFPINPFPIHYRAASSLVGAPVMFSRYKSPRMLQKLRHISRQCATPMMHLLKSSTPQCCSEFVVPIVFGGHIAAPSWCRHQMETFSALLAICAGNSPVPGEFRTQRPVTRSLGVFFDLRLNKRLSKNREAGDLRRYRAHYDVTVMLVWFKTPWLHHQAVRHLIIRPRGVSKPRDWVIQLSCRSEIWPAPRQQCCRVACQISERSDNSIFISRRVDTLRDQAVSDYKGPVWSRHCGIARQRWYHQCRPMLTWLTQGKSERWHTVESHATCLLAVIFHKGLHQSTGCFHIDLCLWYLALVLRYHAMVQGILGDSYGDVSAHCGVGMSVHIDGTDVGFRMTGFRQNDTIHIAMTSWF